MKILLFSLFLLFNFYPLHTENYKIKVGIIDFTSVGVEDNLSKIVTELFRTELIKTKRYDVLERKNMDKLLDEIEFQLSSVTDAQDAVQIGKQLNMEYMIFGSVSMLGKQYLITVNMVEIETGKIIYSENQKTDTFEDVDIDIKILVLALTGEPINKYEDQQTKKTPEKIKEYLEKKYTTCDNKRIRYEILGYVYEYDEIIEDYYAFLVYKEINIPTKEYILKISSNHLVTIVLSEENILKTAETANKENKPYEVISKPFSAPKGDPRRIEYRLYHDKGIPDAIEIYIVTRTEDWQSRPEKIFRHRLNID